MILPSGSILSEKYRIDRLLRETSSRRIYHCKHVLLDRMYAVHVIRDFDSKKVIATERFLRESMCQAIAAPNLAEVCDVGTLEEENGAPFMVTEPLDGWWLSDRLARGSLKTAEAVMWLVQGLAALEALHAQDVVHRDFNPQHMVVVPLHHAGGAATTAASSHGEEILKLVGLGVARRMTAAVDDPRELIGSPHYIAPEQLRNAADADPRADIWSWGVSLYEALTGRHPFEGETLGEIFAASLEMEPVPLTGRDVPSSLEAIVLRCLAKKRADRFQSAAEIRTALDQARSSWTS